MRAWTIIISDHDGDMWMNTEEAHSAEEATVQGLATWAEDNGAEADNTGILDEVRDAIAIPGSHQDAAAWQIHDADQRRSLLERARAEVVDGATEVAP